MASEQNFIAKEKYSENVKIKCIGINEKPAAKELPELDRLRELVLVVLVVVFCEAQTENEYMYSFPECSLGHWSPGYIGY